MAVKFTDLQESQGLKEKLSPVSVVAMLIGSVIVNLTMDPAKELILYIICYIAVFGFSFLLFSSEPRKVLGRIKFYAKHRRLSPRVFDDIYSYEFYDIPEIAKMINPKEGLSDTDEEFDFL